MAAGRKIQINTHPSGSFLMQIPGPASSLEDEILVELKDSCLFGGDSSSSPEEFSQWEFSRQNFLETAYILESKGFILDGIHPDDLLEDEMPWLEDC